MSVLILGATSRIGQQIAHRFAEAGHPVYVAARDVAEAERIAADVRIRHQAEAQAGAFDATDFDGHAALLDRVEAAVGAIEVAVLAFGEMGDQETSQADFNQAHKVIDINYTGAVSVCEALAARLGPRGRGAIIGITSVAGDRGRQSNYIYGSAKGAFTLYLQGLRNRLFGQSVKVMTVRLGFVDTRMTFGLSTGIPIASPERISAALYAAWQHGEDDVYLPRFWRGIMGVIRAVPEGVFKRLSL
ncbi:MAG: SDR family oxidoreductase [Myxococcales bacterium]|nr:SDR family oxidoreductase [Myxococcales bacterium]